MGKTRIGADSSMHPALPGVAALMGWRCGYLRDDFASAVFAVFLGAPVFADAAVFAGVAAFAGFDGPAARAAFFDASVFIVRIVD